MKTKFLSILLILMMAFSTVACAYEPDKNNIPDNKEDVEITQDPNQLDILKTDRQFTQEQMLSRIKGEYLLRNNGYRADDEVNIMVSLKGKALIDSYNNDYASFDSVGKYARTFSGQVQATDLYDYQTRVINNLSRSGYIGEVKYRYNTVMNGFSAKTTYGKIKDIEKFDGVESVILSDTYNLPKVSENENRVAVENPVDIDEKTGIYNSASSGYTGSNTSVAILDSGFDCSHSVFQHMPDKVMYTEDDIKWYFNEGKTKPETRLNAFETSPDLEFNDVYHSEKIPYTYDYADKDYDVFPYDSSHGTHVAGIIGGKDAEITGVAIDTQLVLMKVFPDHDQGADTQDIVAALDDAVKLGVDCINMSLGSSCGFVRDSDKHDVNAIYDKINLSGISLLTAASNSFSAGFGGAQGNTNLVTNPDSGTVGSPSTYPAALSVASISGKKSKYLVANGKDVLFFDESNHINGKPNNFFEELGVGSKEGMVAEKEFEYVTIPGVGLPVNYSGFKRGELKGKIVLVRRGDNTFEEKAAIAKSKGAAGCIIYNNIDGDIIMSMGKSDHIPTISISKDNGRMLAQHKKGTLLIKNSNEAGPFMSDFSSWGPTPSLGLKPEITAHGGNIHSAVPGGGYEDMSGTSMATPNLCGVAVLIRQYIKDYCEAHAIEMTAREQKNLANQLLMSTATIALNEESRPYSPRKQGAGLANLKNAVTTQAYITVDGSDRTKLELKDDPKKQGVYTMKFNVKNFGATDLTYNLSLVGMTETVSKFDEKRIAETPTILSGKCVFSDKNGQVSGDKITIPAGEQVAVTAVYTLSREDKIMMDKLFPYGMYVEGFVKLTNDELNPEGEKKVVDLNIPFLAFYGDWTEAPMFDKTFYEVDKEACDGSIDEEDKLKADYLATTPYGCYFYDYMIPLGKYIYDIDKNLYDPMPADADKIAISDVFGRIDGINTIYAGLLRNAKEMYFTITDKVTGEVVWEHTDYDATKAYSNGGTPIPYFEFINMRSIEHGLVNNRQYEFKMFGKLDYELGEKGDGRDGGAATNVRNQFAFDFYMDDEAPVIKAVSYEKKYDRGARKDRYYMTMTVCDNHYVQSITPVIFTEKGYTFLAKNPIPVNGKRGADVTVKFEITDYIQEVGYDALVNNGLSFSIDDYALNSAIYICQLPGTRGDFKFTKDGTTDGRDLRILSLNQGEVADLTKYLATTDKTVDDEKDYLKYLTWKSSDESIAEVHDGLVKCKKSGKVTISVYNNQVEMKRANLILNIRAGKVLSEEPGFYTANNQFETDDYEKGKVKSIRFSHYETLFAFPNGSDFSQIGETGNVRFISATGGLSMYPGEKVKLYPDIQPWYAADNYKVEYASNNTKVKISEDGTLEALKHGSATITMSIKELNLYETLKITVKKPFIIENRMLMGYKGKGEYDYAKGEFTGVVEIPNDEGILFIGPYAFSLYEVDVNKPLPKDDYDANKTAKSNEFVKSIIVPEGVEDIQKYAFANCPSLQSVKIASTVKFIREFAFLNDKSLVDIDLNKAMVVGESCFEGCVALESITMNNMYALGDRAFYGCSKLTNMVTSRDESGKPLSYSTLDLTKLRSTGKYAFAGCKALNEVVTGPYTKLSYGMFANSGLTSFEINSIGIIPEGCFYNCANLSKITLPDGKVQLDGLSFYGCSSLSEVVIRSNTRILGGLGGVFKGTKLAKFTIDGSNLLYKTSTDGRYLINAGGNEIIFVAPYGIDKNIVIGSEYTKIKDGAFSGTDIESVTFNGAVEIGKYAFAYCPKLAHITFTPEFGSDVVIGDHAFSQFNSELWLQQNKGFITENMEFKGGFVPVTLVVDNLASVMHIGDFAFERTGIVNVAIGEGAYVGEGAFVVSYVETATIGANAKLDRGAFNSCVYLTTVTMPEAGGVTIGDFCFENDKKLVEIDLSTLIEIPLGAFKNCVKLGEANLMNVVTIGDFAFTNDSGIKILNVPKVKEIGHFAFARGNEYARGASMKDLVLPETLEFFGRGAFLGCEGLENLTVKKGVTHFEPPKVKDENERKKGGAPVEPVPEDAIEIPYGAFMGCTALKNIVLGENINRIGDSAFQFCKAITSIKTIGSEKQTDYAIDIHNIKYIGSDAFSTSEGSEMTGRVNAENLLTVGDLAFRHANLKEFNAPKLEKIGIGAFQSNGFVEFTFADTIKEVGSFAFNACYDLKSFSFLKNGKKLTDGNINDNAKIVDGVLYTKLPTGQWMLSSVPNKLEIKTLNVMKGTTRIDAYAGNANPTLENIVFPDGLLLIGDHAFFSCGALKNVEFNSIKAPALENAIVKDRRMDNTYFDINQRSEHTLHKGDPGYEILYEYHDIIASYVGEVMNTFNYCNFITLAGKSKQKINIVLSANENLEGYDSLVYKVYFGDITKDTERNDYIAMEDNLIKFIQYARRVKNLPAITLSNEELINEAVSKYNALTQSGVDYNMSEEEWNELVDVVLTSKKTLSRVKLSKATEKIKNVQSKIDALPAHFDIKQIDLFRETAEHIDKLDGKEKAYLDLSEYNKLLKEYEKYRQQIEPETMVTENASKEMGYSSVLKTAVMALGGLSLSAVIGFLFKHVIY